MSSFLKVVFTILSLLFVTSFTNAHICVMYPAQRGALNITTYGNPTCFKYKGPCGNLPAETPKVTISTGNNLNIQMQQNLNHYSIGNAGYLEISIAPLSQSLDEDNFQVLTILTDYFPVRQWTRTNFTIPITIPSLFKQKDGSNLPLQGHSVIRARYIPNKPTEPIFHQCLDINVVRTNSKRIERVSNRILSRPLFNMYKERVGDATNAIYGIVKNPLNDYAIDVVKIDLNDKNLNPNVVVSMNGVIPSDGQLYTNLNDFGYRLYNGVTAVDRRNKRLFYLLNMNSKDINSIPNTIVVVDLARTTIASYNINGGNNNYTISSLIYNEVSDSLLASSLIKTNNTYNYALINISLRDLRTQVVAITKGIDISPYVDFLYSGFNPSLNIHYSLIRHEDEPLTMVQQLYRTNLNTGKIEIIELSTDEYVFSNFHVLNSKTEDILTFSPGSASDSLPVEKLNIWKLVELKADGNSVDMISREYVTTPFANYLGGSIVNGLNSNDIVHLFKDENGNDVLYKVDVESGRQEKLGLLKTKMFNIARL